VLAVAAFQRIGGVREAEPIPRFREILLQRGARGTSDKIVVITMRGLISSSLPGSITDSMVDDMRVALQQARDDDRVKGIVLEIDSPGGEVTASDAIYSALIKARARKPVVIYMDSLAASGGYYVSCGGKFLMASETTITGSIGVIIQTLNYEQLFNKVGLASVVFKSGKFKDMLNGARPITPEERELVQSFIMKTYDKFLGIVAKERNLPADLLRNTIADGRIHIPIGAHPGGPTVIAPKSISASETCSSRPSSPRQISKARAKTFSIVIRTSAKSSPAETFLAAAIHTSGTNSSATCWARTQTSARSASWPMLAAPICVKPGMPSCVALNRLTCGSAAK